MLFSQPVFTVAQIVPVYVIPAFAAFFFAFYLYYQSHWSVHSLSRTTAFTAIALAVCFTLTGVTRDDALVLPTSGNGTDVTYADDKPGEKLALLNQISGVYPWRGLGGARSGRGVSVSLLNLPLRLSCFPPPISPICRWTYCHFLARRPRGDRVAHMELLRLLPAASERHPPRRQRRMPRRERALFEGLAAAHVPAPPGPKAVHIIPRPRSQ